MTHVIVFTLLGLIGWHAGEVYKARYREPDVQEWLKSLRKRQITDSERRIMKIPKGLAA